MANVYTLRDGEKMRTTIAVKASNTVIPAKSLVGITSGLIVAGAAAHTKLAYCPNGAAAGTTEVEISKGNDFTLVGAAGTAFAAANRGAEVDISDTTQAIDLTASSTDVLTIGVTADSGTVGSASEIEFKINKPII